MVIEPTTASPEVIAIRDRMTRGDSIAWDEVVAWMQSGDIELEGAAFNALMESASGVVGDVDADVANEFIFSYLLGALSARGTPTPIFGMEPHIAGQCIADIYKHHRLQGSSLRQLANTRDALAVLYVSGKASVVESVLEHILEEPECRRDFDGWKNHPMLRRVYTQALEGSEKPL
jgi:hypothetical protein